MSSMEKGKIFVSREYNWNKRKTKYLKNYYYKEPQILSDERLE